MKATITGMGSYLPKKVLTNSDLETIVDTTDEWITTRTGMKERRIAGHLEYTSNMGVLAAKRALLDTNTDPKSLDLIIFATLTPDYLFPSTACLLQAELGAVHAAAFDLQAACTGFLYALSTAKAFVESGMYRRILIVCAEKLSSIVDYQDRKTCVLFGDGAFACIVEPCESTKRVGLAIDCVRLGSDGTKAELIILPAGGVRLPPSEETIKSRSHYLQMEGRELFKHAVRRMEGAIKESLQAANIEEKDIDWLIPHQANIRIIDALAKRFAIPEERVFLTIHKYGNTSASSVGIALEELMKTGQVKTEEKLMLVAFGAGLTFGSAILTRGEK